MRRTLVCMLLLAAGPLVAQDSLQQPGFTRSLSAITITAAKPLVEKKNDRIIVNVDRMITASSGNVLELLGKMPGVSVDQAGSIRYNNKQGVLVLIDDRPTYLTGNDLVTFLQNMQGNEIQRVEIIPNPPARYDAAGNAGILNIKTKKGLKRGMNGSLTAGYSQGSLPRENAALNLNFRNSSWNVYGSLSAQDTRNESKQRNDRTFAGQDRVNGQDAIRQHYWSGGLKAGADHTISSKSSIGILVNTNLLDGSVRSATNSEVWSAGALTDRLATTTRFDMKREIASGNLNFRQRFSKPDQELSADLNYVYYHAASDQQIHTRFHDAAGAEQGLPLQLRSHAPVQIDIWAAKVDYTHPLGTGMRLETGMKTSYVSNNNALRYQRLQEGKWEEDARTNQFSYRESINAAYVNYAATWGAFSLQAGLRAEHTHGTGRQRQGGLRFTRDTLNFFPTLFVNYQPSGRHNIGVNYGRRIERPQYELLNPFIIMLDTLTAEQGNPALRPQYVNNFGLSYTYDRALQLSLEYSATSNVMSKIVRQAPGEKTTIFMYENISRLRTATASVSYNAMLTRWWQAVYYAALIHTRYKGVAGGSNVSLHSTAFNANINNSFRWERGWSAEAGAIYNGRYLNNFLGMAQPVLQLNVGLAKSLWDNKAKIQLSVNNITWQAERMHTDYGHVHMYNWYRGDSRRVGLTFTWKFGKTTVEKQRDRATGAGDEENRLKL